MITFHLVLTFIPDYQIHTSYESSSETNAAHPSQPHSPIFSPHQRVATALLPHTGDFVNADTNTQMRRG
ncbi:hypothetical protein B5X24_HaOG207513 [Helicoverpa armigera]|nr:hypothetical protein B5X24_HaOG207513 [Helicoverpa armigera]